MNIFKLRQIAALITKGWKIMTNSKQVKLEYQEREDGTEERAVKSGRGR